MFFFSEVDDFVEGLVVTIPTHPLTTKSEIDPLSFGSI